MWKETPLRSVQNWELSPYGQNPLIVNCPAGIQCQHKARVWELRLYRSSRVWEKTLAPGINPPVDLRLRAVRCQWLFFLAIVNCNGLQRRREPNQGTGCGQLGKPSRRGLPWISSALSLHIENIYDWGAWRQTLICMKWPSLIIRCLMWQQGRIAKLLAWVSVTIHRAQEVSSRELCQGLH